MLISVGHKRMENGSAHQRCHGCVPEWGVGEVGNQSREHEVWVAVGLRDPETGIWALLREQLSSS